MRLDYEGDHVVVWGWDECRFAVLQDGEVLPPDALVGLPFPSAGLLKKIWTLEALTDAMSNSPRGPDSGMPSSTIFYTPQPLLRTLQDAWCISLTSPPLSPRVSG